MPPTLRAIDTLPPPLPSETKSLQVLVVGAPRSGTTSLGTALQLLGYETCIGVAQSFRENLFPYWTEAIAIKHLNHPGKTYDAEDYKKFLGKYEAITGWGAALLAEDMISSFPSAKVILTSRDPDRWVESYNGTIIHVYLWWLRWRWLLSLCGKNSIEKQFVHLEATGVHAWSYGSPLDREEQKRHYLDHNQKIRDLVPKERLLEFHPQDGWRPLCAFLGREVPKVAHPHSMAGDGFHADMNRIWRRAVMKAAMRVSAGSLMATLLFWGLWKSRRGQQLVSRILRK